MHGIPIDCVIGGEKRTLYLSTRRRDDAFRSMRREWNALRGEAALNHARLAQLGRQTETGEITDAQIDRLAALSREREHIDEQSIDLAERIVLSALEGVENPGEILCALSDRQLIALCNALEIGDVPADFSRAADIRQTPNGTGPSGVESSANSSNTGGRKPTSTPAGSGSRMASS